MEISIYSDESCHLEQDDGNNLCIYNPKKRYITILGERKNYYLLVTAYYIKEEHRHKKLIKEYDEYTKNKGSLIKERISNTPSTPGR